MSRDTTSFKNVAFSISVTFSNCRNVECIHYDFQSHLALMFSLFCERLKSHLYVKFWPRISHCAFSSSENEFGSTFLLLYVFKANRLDSLKYKNAYLNCTATLDE